MTDYNFGITQEKTLLPTLQKKFGETLSRATNKYCRYDFHNDSCLIVF